MTDVRWFGGIDFSGAREPLSTLWTAVGEERDGKLCIVSVCPHPYRADLAAFVGEGWRRHAGVDEGTPIVWGADFPFGVPREALARMEGIRETTWR